MKKFLCILVAMILMLSVFSLMGCGGDDSGEEIDENVDINIDPNITATLNIALRDEDSEEESMIEVEEAFQEEFPNVTFKNTRFSNYETQIIGDFQAGVRYDVVWAADSYVTNFADNGMLQCLDIFIEKEGERSGFSTEDYYESLINLGKYRHGVAPNENDDDGVQYFLPRDYSKIAVYLNKALFRRFGVAVPTNNNWSFTDFCNTCAALKEKMDQAGGTEKYYPVEGAWDWRIMMYGFTSSYGGVFIEDDGNPRMDKNFQKGLADIQNLIKNGYTYFLEDGMYDQFGKGLAAMRLETRSQAMTYASTIGGSDLAVIAFPKIGKDGCCGTGTTGYGIWELSKQKVLAWNFLNFLLGEQGQDIVSSTGLTVPSLISVAEDPSSSWRNVGDLPSINSNAVAFISSSTKDVIQDYYDCLTDSATIDTYDGCVVKMLKNIFKKGGTATISSEVAKCIDEIFKSL